MTTDQPLVNQEPPAATAAPAARNRFLSWIWPGVVTPSQERVLLQASERVGLLTRRARDLSELTGSLLASGDFPEGAAEVGASELYRQAAYWAARALSPSADERAGNGYDELVWDTLSQELVAQAAAAGDAARLDAVLRSGALPALSGLQPNEQQAALQDVRRLVALQLAELDRPEKQVLAVYLQRLGRIALLGLVLAGAATGAYLALRPPDLAVGARWRASSTYEGAGCKSPLQDCGESFFFHTAQEDKPWVEFDLGSPKTVSAVSVENRSTYPERAVPLVVEVSTDQHKWREVARTAEEFKTWNKSFTKVSARFVRLRAEKQTLLHLARVHIY